jgi:hypothetical protein
MPSLVDEYRVLQFLQIADFARNCNEWPQRQTNPLTLEPYPITNRCGGTDFVTTAPAATIANSPMVIPARITAPAPIATPRSIFVGTSQFFFLA